LQNFKLVIEYDGTAYHGWQRQKESPTIQGTIEAALATITGTGVTLIGSGRTDAGVHALGQVANFKVESTLTADVFMRALNSLLPSDIVIKACEEVARAFHARYDALSKVYDYRILNRALPSALFRKHAWHIRKDLDVRAMREAMACLKGRHDFSAFEAAGSPRADSVRTGMDLRLAWEKESDYLVFTMEADGFLRFMVRNVLGTLVEVGLGKMSPERFKDVLASRDRAQAGMTAPAHGLTLREVRYGDMHRKA
jgi:tRNA pseudouridine38-40 synthase